MAGHVFHPGHHELHGITVVVHAQDSRILIGRFDRQDESGVYLIGVSIYDPADSPMPSSEFLTRSAKFGVRVDRPHLIIPTSDVRTITPLGSLGLA
jgi:hypothetical protein